MSNLSLYDRIGGKAVISTIVDSFYHKMQDDYRLNRLFNSTEQEQTDALKKLVAALSGGFMPTNEERTELMSNFFITAFARGKRDSFIAGNDFGFFGMVIGQDHPSTKYLCDGHRFLLKFMPDDFHYDAVMEILAASLQQLNLDSTLIKEVLTWAEQGRDKVLGK